MHEMEPGRIVRSVAGHDKFRFYVVTRVDENRVWIADGKMHKLEKPKAKNPKHLRVTKTLIDADDPKTDKYLRTLLKPFNRNTGDAVQEEGG